MNQPSQEVLLKEYNEGNAELKAALERIHGKETFDQPEDFTNLKTLADCCQKQDIDIEHVKVSLPPSLSKYQGFLQATLEAAIVRDAIADNEEIKIGQWRYFPYFREQAGVGFVFSDSANGGGTSTLGSRLEFPKKEQSDYFGKQFTELNKRRLVG